MKEKIHFFDLLRCLAATAVVVIHVLGPYRHLQGTISDSSWAFAVLLNSFSRWTVPVFILITGSLMLNDSRPFDPKYYVSRRLGKVFLPFAVWSLLYALLSAFTAKGVNFETSLSLIKEFPFHETYYHLGFFYYFIPLYLVIPFLTKAMKLWGMKCAVPLFIAWLVLITANLCGYSGFWAHNMFFYTGYLIAGYILFTSKHVPQRLLILLTITMLGLTAYMVLSESFATGEYSTGRWMSYKTINTALIAMGLFVLCQKYDGCLNERLKKGISFVSRYSLGIYLLHPLFLWPVREFNLYWGHSAIMIPLWTIVSGSLALYSAYLLSKSKIGARLLP